MTPIAQHISAFLQQRLPMERGASENTCDSYAYAFQPLFLYAAQRFKIEPSALVFEQIDAPLVVDFLNHVRHEVVYTAVMLEGPGHNLVFCHQYPTKTCGWSNLAV